MPMPAGNQPEPPLLVLDEVVLPTRTERPMSERTPGWSKGRSKGNPGPRPWVVAWRPVHGRRRRVIAAYKTKEAAERCVVELEQRPDLWDHIERRYPDPNGAP